MRYHRSNFVLALLIIRVEFKFLVGFIILAVALNPAA